MNELSFASFGRALAALERALYLYAQHREGELRVSMRNSLILEFEISFGLCRPFLERCLVEFEDEAPQEVAEMTYAELVRTANQRGYLRAAWKEWQRFRNARNLTAHAYSEPKAEEIAALIPAYFAEAKFLYDRMREKSEAA